MNAESLYKQIGQRTDGSIYIGVVGPVRTGKSTFVKRFMEQLVIPRIKNVYLAERAKDELPQSGDGRTIMTAEPKFVPEQPVQIMPDENSRLSVRLIDSVGYLIPGALGAEEDGQPRTVTTPWTSAPISMEQAAELGTKKVMQEHSSVGVVVTTDGSVTELPRQAYLQAEQRSVEDMKQTGKPFVVLVNTQSPQSRQAQELCRELEASYGVKCIALNCRDASQQELLTVLQALLEEFPVTELRFFIPMWVQALPLSHPVKAAVFTAMRQTAERCVRLSQANTVLEKLNSLEQIEGVSVSSVELGSGVINCTLRFPEKLFYSVLSAESGFSVADDAELMRLLTELSETKQRYDRVSAAIAEVYEKGYGVVMPDAAEMTLEEPKIIRKNGSCAVSLRASAPSIHMIRADVQTELSPMVGDEQQSQELIGYLMGEFEDDTQKLWQSNLFGKSLYELVSEGIGTKLKRMPEDVQTKLRGTLTKIINENTGGLICIIL